MFLRAPLIGVQIVGVVNGDGDRDGKGSVDVNCRQSFSCEGNHSGRRR